MTPEQALDRYKKIVEKEQEIHAKIASDLEKLALARNKAREWLQANATDVDAPEWLIETDPETYWAICKKSDGAAATTYMTIRDKIIPQAEAESDKVVKPLKSVMESIEQWSLAELQKRGSDSFKVNGIATCSIRENVRYGVIDKTLFVADAVKNGYVSELTISVRPNSKLMKEIVLERGETPAGVQSHRELKIVMTKN